MTDQEVIDKLSTLAQFTHKMLDGKCVFLSFHDQESLFGSTIRHTRQVFHIAYLVGCLPHLQYLNLRKARLGFAPQVTSQDLLWLDLSCNDLVQVPKWLLWQTRLQELNLGANRLVAVPDLDHLPLKTLKLHKNQLTILPAVPAELQHLNICMNRFVSVPSRIAELTELECLSVGGPTIQAAPSFAALTKMRWLTIACTQLDKLPPGVEIMRDLECLLAPKNRLESVPDLATWPKLVKHSFYGNFAGKSVLVSK